MCACGARVVLYKCVYAKRITQNKTWRNMCGWRGPICGPVPPRPEEEERRGAEVSRAAESERERVEEGL